MPKVLLVTTLYWASAARQAIALQQAGLTVEAVCRRGHALEATGAVTRFHRYRSLWPLDSLQAGILAAQPDFIVAADDDSVIRLHALSRRAAGQPALEALSTLIEHSLGSSARCALATRRGELMALAAAEGVRIPATQSVTHAAELERWLQQARFPAVIKGEGSCGGVGVAVVNTAAEARAAQARLSAVPSLLRAAKRWVVNNDVTLLERRRTLGGQPANLIAQDFVADSTPANRAVLCWQGEVLAGISVAAVETAGALGPVAIVRVIEHAEMAEAARRLVRRLGLSGHCAFDFMLQRGSDAAYLIEANPRVTPIAHLALGPGRNIPAALAAKLLGQPVDDAVAVTEQALIATFPTAWWQNPEHPQLQTVFHDVPWDRPQLIEACVDRLWQQTDWRQKLRTRRRRWPAANRVG